MKISSETYPSPKGDITIYRIENASGAYVELSSLGAGIYAVGVPDYEGKIDNVALSYANPADYLYDGPCMGKVPGRYANRIAKGKFNIDGKEYSLAINNGPNALHGGPEGFQNRIWNSEPTATGVIFRRTSPAREEGYPATLNVTACYEWSEDNCLTLTLTAETDAPTIVNLTNHAYWNLSGADKGSVLSHKLQLNASTYLPTDETLIPTGEIAPVAGTPMDFTTPKEIGRDIKDDFPALNFGKGYDNCWVVDRKADDTLTEAAVLSDPVSRRTLRVASTQPGVQVYTGNWLAGSPLNHSGRPYCDYEGVAIEMQGFPDAPNHANFPSQELRPGEAYKRVIRFSFGID